ncbi:MAG: plasmid stabilization protein [Deltaproteobacteria bacterium GWC2_42_51]|nr:MAG: plasmid stabilization protein [Deltaproteobacteria bacterium GWA2_42_85]OGP27202.1 MAG: plasmid stabilization protein [Deltaproteobacteria bacterium GWB2_42_7]OGP31184.1 MAG: plasmid stabilization protein [Deltaproteobacteria bacterium GWC2_42_51]OGP43387.1 MAG: plasmid stabilization protein [Deltaproteobacteria bacterium GWD2_42_10]OGP46125.1 MAG: plasmid stabilization protein [Deltaproteobacteria bacterium GWF2_42_12]OGQ24658.1 MAG: plasmid stabilization protein [Deltaproteobacteria 
MKYSFHPDAEKELNEAIAYYNECQNGLGLEFAKELYLSIQNILSFPHAWAPLSANTRRCLTNRFPYGVIYQITDEEVFIIAVMYLNREPSYWKNRGKRHNK